MPRVIAIITVLLLAFAAGSSAAVAAKCEPKPKAACKGAKLQGAKLSGKNLRGIDLRGANLRGADLRRVNLTGAKLDRANLRGARMQRANLTRASLLRADLRRAKMRGVRLVGATLSRKAGGMEHSRAALGAAKRETQCTTISCKAALLAGADLTQAILLDGMLFGNDLRGAQLAGADLSGLSLAYGDLSGANLEGANLSGAKIERTTIQDIRLAGATVKGLISGGNIGQPASFPAGWTVRSGYLAGPGAVISWESGLVIGPGNPKREPADFSGVDLTGAIIGSVGPMGLRAMDGTSSDVPRGECVADYVAKMPGFPNTIEDFTGWSFRDANLTDTRFCRARLDGVDFRGATMTRTDLRRHNPYADGVPSREGLRPLFAGVDLRTALLQNADIERADFTGANLEGQDLWSVPFAILTRARVEGTSFRRLCRGYGKDQESPGYESCVTSGEMIGVPAALPPGDTQSGREWSVADGYFVSPWGKRQ